MSGFLSGSVECLIWILGHSYVCWGAKSADVRQEGRQLFFLRQEAKVRWIGVPGMLWLWVIPEIYQYAMLNSPRDMLLLHAQGNDLGLRASREIDIKLDFLRLKSSFPRTLLVWLDMVARTS